VRLPLRPSLRSEKRASNHSILRKTVWRNSGSRAYRSWLTVSRCGCVLCLIAASQGRAAAASGGTDATVVSLFQPGQLEKAFQPMRTRLAIMARAGRARRTLRTPAGVGRR
jgi:hypothetical protein